MVSIDKNFLDLLRPVRYSLIVGSLASFFGFNLGLFLANKEFLINYFIMDPVGIRTLWGTNALGSILGITLGACLLAGSGRKILIISSSVFGQLAVLSSFIAPSYSALLCAFLVVGICFGMYLLSGVIYICEISIARQRGFSLMLIPAFFLLGGVIAILIKDVRVVSPSSLSLYVFLFLHVFLIVLSFIKLKDSPRFLAYSGQSESALSVLISLRGDMAKAAKELASINDTAKGSFHGFSLFIANSNFRRELFAIFFIIVFVHFAGITLVPYTLFEISSWLNFANEYRFYDFSYDLIKASAIVLLFGVLTAVFSVDKLGRRKLLIVSTSAALIINALISLILIMPNDEISIILLFVLSICFMYCISIGFTVLAIVFASELLPSRAREFGLAIFLIANYVSILFITQVYDHIFELIGFSGIFFVSLLFCAFLLFLIYILIPETKDLTLEELDNRILQGRALSDY